MTDYVSFVAAYRTNLVLPPFGKCVIDPVKIEVTEGPIRLIVPVVHRGAPVGVDGRVFEQQELRLPDGSIYLIATARMEFKKSSRPSDARRFCEDALDRVLAILAIKYSPDLFSNLVYRG